MNGYEFRTALAQICPDYAIDEDNDGQLVIYTNLMEVGDDEYVRWEEKNPSGGTGSRSISVPFG